MASRIGLEQIRPPGRARGIVSSRRSGQRIEAQRYRPSPDMRRFVAEYWMGRWDLTDQPPHVTEMLGDPCVHIVFERGPSGDASRVVGVWTRLWRRTLEGRGRVRGVKLRAGGVRAFIDLPATQLANRIMPLRDVFDGVEALHAAVLGPTNDEEAFGALEAWLRARPLPGDADAIEAAIEVVEHVARDPELTTAAQLAAWANRTPRALQRMFRDYVGASPKWVIRRNRLQEVAARIERGETPTLAALAADLGYADQAHLARDFKRVVGKSPSEFAATV
ncbi:MAG: helix-turn-helix domain-containing protein [Myxococcota bacterium]